MEKGITLFQIVKKAIEVFQFEKMLSIAIVMLKTFMCSQ